MYFQKKGPIALSIINEKDSYHCKVYHITVKL